MSIIVRTKALFKCVHSQLLVDGFEVSSCSFEKLKYISIYTLSDLGVLSNLIGLLSLAMSIIHPLPSE